MSARSTRLHCEQLETRDTPTSYITPLPLASGLVQPTAMAVSPDGRIFVAEKAGTIRVVQNNAVLATPFTSLSVNTADERGLIGVALDPNFTTNGFVYTYYTAAGPTPVNRVSRFTANGNVGANETVLLDNISATSGVHNGGALVFGADGKLYVGVGDAGDGSNAQALTNLNGKVLRLNPDGTIPADNPFYATATGDNRAIYALGLRNPFAMAVQPGTGRLFINDVGSNRFEEVNEGAPGANYGWPGTEGPFDPASYPNFVPALYAYPHRTLGLGDNSITGGTFYNPTTSALPAEYVGDYFFADFPTGSIFVRDGSTGEVRWFNTLSQHKGVVDLDVLPNGSLISLNFELGQIHAIEPFGNSVPMAGPIPLEQTIAAGTGSGTPSQVAVLTATGDVRSTFRAYEGYNGDVRVASADVNGDGIEDIITGTGLGAVPHVKVFDGATGAVIRSFLAFDPAYRGGLYVAAGDINGDGLADIIVGSAAGSSHVKVFDAVTGAEVRSFFAFDGFRGGVTVAPGYAAGRVGAGIAVGTATGSSHVKVFNGMTGETVSSFLAFGSDYRGGVSVASVGGPLAVGTAAGSSHVKVFSDNREVSNFYAFAPVFAGGVRVAGNGSKLVVGAGPGAGPQIKLYDPIWSDAVSLSRFVFDPALSGGVFVG